VLFVVFVLYGLSGYGDAVWRMMRHRKSVKAVAPLHEDEK
jgi:CDP-diacylglycerol--serine O-phosphatidyltransferase